MNAVLLVWVVAAVLLLAHVSQPQKAVEAPLSLPHCF